MKTFDIRRDDIVIFHQGINEKEKERIAKFARRVDKQNEIKQYAFNVIDKGLTFKVKQTAQTKKVPTEYAILISKDNILIPVQTRYLEVFERKPKHPLTWQFQ
jgi:nitrate reductase assembly molybdenum cofactor insertion protein NarJ